MVKQDGKCKVYVLPIMTSKCFGDIISYLSRLVCTMAAWNAAPAVPRLFRSYEASSSDELDCPIWQVARATTASPLLSMPIEIGTDGMRESFIEGCYGCNNPINILFDQAFGVFPDRSIACVVSLGAGQLPPASPLDRNIVDFLERIARDCEAVTNEVEGKLERVGIYYRFNVPNGVDTSNTHKNDHAAAVMRSTQDYISEVEITSRMVSVAKALVTRTVGKISTQRLCTCYYAPSPNGSVVTSYHRSIRTLYLWTALPPFQRTWADVISAFIQYYRPYGIYGLT